MNRALVIGTILVLNGSLFAQARPTLPEAARVRIIHQRAETDFIPATHDGRLA